MIILLYHHLFVHSVIVPPFDRVRVLSMSDIVAAVHGINHSNLSKEVTLQLQQQGKNNAPMNIKTKTKNKMGGGRRREHENKNKKSKEKKYWRLRCRINNEMNVYNVIAVPLSFFSCPPTIFSIHHRPIRCPPALRTSHKLRCSFIAIRRRRPCHRIPCPDPFMLSMLILLFLSLSLPSGNLNASDISLADAC